MTALVGLAVAAVLVALLPDLGTSDDAPPAVVDRALVADRPEVKAARLLRAWDGRRSAAWAAADSTALDALYVVGAPAARAERQMLRAWSERGLRVEGLTNQLLRVEVLDHRHGRWDLEVVGRLEAGRVLSDTGPDLALPYDAARTTRVVLVRGSGGKWVVESLSSGDG